MGSNRLLKIVLKSTHKFHKSPIILEPSKRQSENKVKRFLKNYYSLSGIVDNQVIVFGITFYLFLTDIFNCLQRRPIWLVHSHLTAHFCLLQKRHLLQNESIFSPNLKFECIINVFIELPDMGKNLSNRCQWFCEYGAFLFRVGKIVMVNFPCSNHAQKFK